MSKQIAETGCCPPFDPAPWDGKTIRWKDKLFLHDHVIGFLHVPLNINAVMRKNMARIEQAGALNDTPIMLSDENSLFGSEIYIAVRQPVPGADMIKLSGTFLSKVYEGPFNRIGAWVKDMDAYVKAGKNSLKKLYFFYTMCPSCARHYGKNFVVLMAQI